MNYTHNENTIFEEVMFFLFFMYGCNKKKLGCECVQFTLNNKMSKYGQIMFTKHLVLFMN